MSAHGHEKPDMDNDLKSSVYRACRLLLRPVASIALRCGITWREFSDLSKSVFVDVASSEFGIRGRPTNVSRVAVMTGIDRKEVRRQRDLLTAEPESVSRKTSDASRVLSGWHQDPAFLDESGRPLELPEEGPAPSFDALTRRYSGDVPRQTLLKELLGGGTVARTPDGRLRALRRYHVPEPLEPESILRAGAVLKELGDALRQNLYRKADDTPRFEGRASNDRMTAEQAALFREFMQVRGQTFLEEIDDWLSRHEPQTPPPPGKAIRLGVGLFAIESETGGQQRR
jgi:hypothetical protein